MVEVTGTITAYFRSEALYRQLSKQRPTQKTILRMMRRWTTRRGFRRLRGKLKAAQRRVRTQ